MISSLLIGVMSLIKEFIVVGNDVVDGNRKFAIVGAGDNKAVTGI